MMLSSGKDGEIEGNKWELRTDLFDLPEGERRKEPCLPNYSKLL